MSTTRGKKDSEMLRHTARANGFRSDGAAILMQFLKNGPMKDLAALLENAPDVGKVTTLSNSIADMLSGLSRYQAHPYHTATPASRCLWRKGSSRLLAYEGSGPPVLVVPSMINRASIMDLTPALSRMRWLARNGFRPYLFDWGVPGPAETWFEIGDYLEKRLQPAFEAILRESGGPVHLIGYCMGGPIALALGTRQSADIGKIVTLGTPWDFSYFPEHARFRDNQKALEASLMTMGGLFGAIPPLVTHSFFAMRNLESGAKKFQRFAHIDPASAEARRFIAVEDWLNNGVPVPMPVARECFSGWLVDNGLMTGEWGIKGLPLDLSALTSPMMVVVGQRDSVVPPASALPLAKAIPHARLLEPSKGHIGIILAPDADGPVWHPVRDFLMETDP